MIDFIHSRLHSAYSLAEGAIKIDNLVQLCHANKMSAVAVTDSNNLFGALEFSTKCLANGIKPIIGCQLNVQNFIKNDKQNSVLLYAQNENGYKNLVHLVSEAYLHPSSENRPEISLNLLEKFSDNLVLATGGTNGALGTCLLNNDLENAKEYLRFLKNFFDQRCYIEISRHNNEYENQIEENLINLRF